MATRPCSALEAAHPKTVTDGRGVLASYSWDALGRLRAIIYSKDTSSRSFGWIYDETGANFAYAIGRCLLS